jgi:hypothetical protein
MPQSESDPAAERLTIVCKPNSTGHGKYCRLSSTQVYFAVIFAVSSTQKTNIYLFLKIKKRRKRKP